MSLLGLCLWLRKANLPFLILSSWSVFLIFPKLALNKLFMFTIGAINYKILN